MKNQPLSEQTETLLNTHPIIVQVANYEQRLREQMAVFERVLDVQRREIDRLNAENERLREMLDVDHGRPTVDQDIVAAIQDSVARLQSLVAEVSS